MHGARGSIDWGVLRRLWTGSLPAAMLTLLLLHYYPENKGLGSIIMPGLGVALVLTSLAMMFQSRLHRLGQTLRTTTPERFKGAQPALTVAARSAILDCW